MKLIKKHINKLFIRLFIIFNNRIDIDFQSNLSLKITKKLKGTNLYKVIIKNSMLSGDICVGEGCRLNGAILSGEVNLDRFVSINGPGTRISSMVNEIKIGSFTSIASNVIIQEYSHKYERISTYYMNQNIFKKDRFLDIYSKGPIIIEEDVWIGSNVVILPGVIIGRGSIIGAGSIITKDVPRYSIVAGNPAKIIKFRFDDDIIQQIEESRWWELSTDKIIEFQEYFNNHIANSNDVKWLELLKKEC